MATAYQEARRAGASHSEATAANQAASEARRAGASREEAIAVAVKSVTGSDPSSPPPQAGTDDARVLGRRDPDRAIVPDAAPVERETTRVPKIPAGAKPVEFRAAIDTTGLSSSQAQKAVDLTRPTAFEQAGIRYYTPDSTMYKKGFRNSVEFRRAENLGVEFGAHQGKLVPEGSVIVKYGGKEYRVSPTDYTPSSEGERVADLLARKVDKGNFTVPIIATSERGETAQLKISPAKAKEIAGLTGEAQFHALQEIGVIRGDAVYNVKYLEGKSGKRIKEAFATVDVQLVPDKVDRGMFAKAPTPSKSNQIYDYDTNRFRDATPDEVTQRSEFYRSYPIFAPPGTPNTITPQEYEKNIKAANEWIEQYKIEPAFGGGYNWTVAANDKAGNKYLKYLLLDNKAVVDLKKEAASLAVVADYATPDGYDIAKFLRANPSGESKVKGLFDDAAINKAKEYNTNYLGIGSPEHFDRAKFVAEYYEKKGWNELPRLSDDVKPGRIDPGWDKWSEANAAYEKIYAPPMTHEQFVKNYFTEKGWEEDRSKLIRQGLSPTKEVQVIKDYDRKLLEASNSYIQKYGAEPVVKQGLGKVFDLVPFAALRHAQGMSAWEIAAIATIDTVFVALMFGGGGLVAAPFKGAVRLAGKTTLGKGAQQAVTAIRTVYGAGSRNMEKLALDLGEAIRVGKPSAIVSMAKKLEAYGQAMKNKGITGADALIANSQNIAAQAEAISIMGRLPLPKPVTNRMAVLRNELKGLGLDAKTLAKSEGGYLSLTRKGYFTKATPEGYSRFIETGRTSTATIPASRAEVRAYGLTDDEAKAIADKVGSDYTKFVEEARALQAAKTQAARDIEKTFADIDEAIKKLRGKPDLSMTEAERKRILEQVTKKTVTTPTKPGEQSIYEKMLEARKNWEKTHVGIDERKSAAKTIVEQAAKDEARFTELAAIAMAQLAAMSKGKVETFLQNETILETLALADPAGLQQLLNQQTKQTQTQILSRLDNAIQEAFNQNNMAKVETLVMAKTLTRAEVKHALALFAKTETVAETKAEVATALKTAIAQETAAALDTKAVIETKPATSPLAKVATATALKIKTATTTAPAPATTPKPAAKTTTTPGIKIPKPPPEKPVKTPKPLIPPGPTTDDKKKRKFLKKARGVIARRRGALGGKSVWHVRYAPYREQDRMILLGAPPAGAKDITGKGSTSRSAILLRGEPPKRTIRVDHGGVDDLIIPTKRGIKIKSVHDYSVKRKPKAPRQPKPKSPSRKVGQQYYTRIGKTVAVSRKPLGRR